MRPGLRLRVIRWPHVSSPMQLSHGVDRKGENKPVTGLEDFKLTEASFRRLSTEKTWADVSLRTYDLTPAVRKLPPAQRHDYLITRVNRWIASLRQKFPKLSVAARHGKLSGDIRRRSDLPSSLRVSGPPQLILAVAGSRGVRTVHVVRVAGFRRRPSPTPSLSWFCVRALVAIRVERATSGWRDVARQLGLPGADIERMTAAYETDQRRIARAMAPA